MGRLDMQSMDQTGMRRLRSQPVLPEGFSAELALLGEQASVIVERRVGAPGKNMRRRLEDRMDDLRVQHEINDYDFDIH